MDIKLLKHSFMVPALILISVTFATLYFNYTPEPKLIAANQPAFDPKCGRPDAFELMGSIIDLSPVEIVNETTAALYQGDFKTIIDSANTWKERNCKLRNGEKKIDFILGGFSNYFRSTQNWEQSLEKIEKFKSAYPDHVLPIFAEAIYWYEYACSIRGGGFPPTANDADWGLFKERLEKSKTILLTSKAKASDWPYWYSILINVENLLNSSPESINAIFDEATNKFKNDLGIYEDMAFYYIPIWKNNWSEIDRIIMLATKKADNEPADAIYARLYWNIGDQHFSSEDFFHKNNSLENIEKKLILFLSNIYFKLQGINYPIDNYSDDFHSTSKVSWKKMRNGFIELLQLYPQSTNIGNKFLAYACLAGDRSTYINYRKVITIYEARAWQTKITRDQCDANFNFKP